ncbi:hypothetical protein RN629_14060 [Sphingomonadaceae bacterium jetA1]|jgi:hypothetical protein|uniref:hypothetical protein n=1 Tax=Facivitalis istanbulensis TaxID=3075838 RepID=UPI0034768639
MLIAVACLSWVAIANGFPLVFSDTGTYLATALQFRYPLDRPPVYGLAILLPVRLAGPWGIVAVQAIGSVLLLHPALTIGRGPLRPTLWLAACILLAIGSSLPWLVGQIMPDLATGFLPLVIFALMARPGAAMPRWHRLGLTGILALLIGVHLSHIPLSVGLLALTIGGLCLTGVPIRQAIRRAVAPAAAIALSVLGLSSMNLIAEDEFKPSLSSDMFILARLLDGHVAQPVLARLCATQPLVHCAIRPLVDDPRSEKPGQAYLWDPRSPLLTPALSKDRARTVAEQKRIIHAVLREDPMGVLALGGRGFVAQLTTVRTGVLPPYGPEMNISHVLATSLPTEMPAFRHGLQQRDALNRLKIFPDVAIAGTIAALLPVMALWAARRRRWPLLGLMALVAATLLLNAAVTGALSGPDDRYQSRVLWLLPLVAIRFLLEWRSAQKAASRP